MRYEISYVLILQLSSGMTNFLTYTLDASERYLLADLHGPSATESTNKAVDKANSLFCHLKKILKKVESSSRRVSNYSTNLKYIVYTAATLFYEPFYLFLLYDMEVEIQLSINYYYYMLCSQLKSQSTVIVG